MEKLIQGRVITYEEIRRQESVRSWEFDCSREYEFTHPEYYNELPEEIGRLFGTHQCASPYVLEAKDITLMGREGHKITGEGKYIVFNFGRVADKSDATRSLATDLVIGISHGSVPNIRPDPDDDLPEIDMAVSLLATHDQNYTHWTQEALTKLQAIEEYESATGNKPTIIIPPDPPDFIAESLDVFGYQEEDYIEWEYEQARVRRLIIPSVRRCLSATSDDWIRMSSAFDWVRDRALSGVRSVAPDEYASRILISREDAATRRMTNRETVAETLANEGFEKYVPGKMSYQEQVRLFSQADFIVGAHGAGLANAIYSSESKVIELFGDHFLPANFELAQGQGREYGCLKCEPVGKDMRVDIGELLDAVDTMTSSQ